MALGSSEAASPAAVPPAAVPWRDVYAKGRKVLESSSSSPSWSSSSRVARPRGFCARKRGGRLKSWLRWSGLFVSSSEEESDVLEEESALVAGDAGPEGWLAGSVGGESAGGGVGFWGGGKEERKERWRWARGDAAGRCARD